MGLFDSLFSDNPNDAAYLALASGLLGGKGSFNSILGGSIQGAQGAYSGALDAQMKRLLMKAQAGDAEAQSVLRRAQADEMQSKVADAAKIFGATAPGAANQYGTSGGGGINLGGVQEPMIPVPGKKGLEVPGLDNSIAAYKARYGVDLLPNYEFAQFGKSTPAGQYRSRPGQPDQYLPKPGEPTIVNGQVSLPPGTTESVGTLTEATAGATKRGQSPYELVNYLNDKGETRQKPLAVILDEIRGSLANPPQSSSPPPSNGTITDKSIMGRFGDAAANFNIGGKQWSQSAAPVDSGGGQGIKTGFSPREQSTVKATDELNKNWIDTSYTSAIKDGQIASDAMSGVQTARLGLSKVGKTGWSTDLQVGAARVLGALGMQNPENFATGAQIFNQAASQKLWQILNEAKGVQTEGDAQRAQATYAQLKNTTKANEFILDLAEAVAQRNINKKDFYIQGMPLARQGGDLTEVDRQWNTRMPSIWEMPAMQKWKK
jgi:hypothetical protein